MNRRRTMWEENDRHNAKLNRRPCVKRELAYNAYWRWISEPDLLSTDGGRGAGANHENLTTMATEWKTQHELSV